MNKFIKITTLTYCAIFIANSDMRANPNGSEVAEIKKEEGSAKNQE